MSEGNNILTTSPSLRGNPYMKKGPSVCCSYVYLFDSLVQIGNTPSPF